MDRSTADRAPQDGDEAVEARILGAAAHLIAEEGFGRLKIGAVCARSGYARSVVFQHFGDKEGLGRRLVEFAVEEFTNSYSEAVAARTGAATATPMDMLRALLDIIFELIRTMPTLNQAFLALWGDGAAEYSALRGTLTEADRRFRFAIAQTVASGVADGSITGVRDADAYASALLAQLRGISMQALIDPDGIDLRGLRAELESGVDRLSAGFRGTL
ncbi:MULTISPECIES: TetR/AcrR family transcriptional regulator [Amycolatopsis]|uniref:TetR family transcriptional regulator n=1 Tax=Amycolatopsis eburnea TaxID=2267691 RepID=A0A3R9DU51_9PSEU|nr:MULTISPECIES: TetR/AcrR family transcriptional regulator [Amycolatopsis]NBH07548.1 TetR family transcriptional regulator [Amycolatopsis sp. SID8362]NED44244.1 TetR family transcriptional regulator [Amycolatopsis sp. SID8362]RSD13545.1 TetR family transcriptional regulator [Amycolatopsis eburnea]